MRRLRVVLITILGAFTVSAVAAAGAQADEYWCAFTGATGPVTGYDNAGEAAQEDGVENVLQDLQNNEGDGIGGAAGLLTDTDDGDGRGETTGQDGSYQFSTAAPGGAAVCLYFPTAGVPFVTSAEIDSQGEYDNVVCGTGWAIDDDSGPFEVTSVTFDDPRGDHVIDADYRIDFAAGGGDLDIRHVRTATGRSGSGSGVVSIEPWTGNCITTDVTQFQTSGAFTIKTFP